MLTAPAWAQRWQGASRSVILGVLLLLGVTAFAPLPNPLATLFAVLEDLSRLSITAPFRLSGENLDLQGLWTPDSVSAQPAHLSLLSDSDLNRYQAALAALRQNRKDTLPARLEGLENPLLRAELLGEDPAPRKRRSSGWLAEIGTLSLPADMPDLSARSLKSPPPPRLSHLPEAAVSALRQENWAQAAQSLSAWPARESALQDKLRGLIWVTARAAQQGERDMARAAAVVAMALVKAQNIPPTPALLWFAGLAFADSDAVRAAGYFQLLSAMDTLPHDDRAGAFFWLGRMLARAGDAAGADLAWRDAARYPRSFYGQLAKAKLGLTPAPDWHLPPFSAAQQEVLLRTPDGQRGLAWLQLGEKERAQTAFRRLLPTRDDALATALMAVSGHAALPALALEVGGEHAYPEGQVAMAALYPVPDWQPEAGYALPQSFLLALMRHESRFDIHATSKDGARGLLQLMPSTARGLRPQEFSNPAILRAALHAPQSSMSLGQEYLLTLMEKKDIGHSLIALLTSYNAGPNNFRAWRRDLAGLKDPLLFIESLPSFQTRLFIKRIIASQALYELRLQGETELPAQLARGEWPRLSKTAAPPAPMPRPLQKLASAR